MSTDDIAYWNAEADNDSRYQSAWWGMDGFIDAAETIEAILAILYQGIGWGGVIEIGCGPGRLLTRMAQRYGMNSFYGYDISEPMLRIARAQMEALGLDNCGASTVLDFPDGQYEFVYCVELFQHLPDAEVFGYLEMARGWLMEGGTMITQWVAAGEPGPRSFPRPIEKIIELFINAGWLGSFDVERAVHPDWLWVTVTK